MVCVSGSPNRALYSRTRGPFAVIMTPVKSMPLNGRPGCHVSLDHTCPELILSLLTFRSESIEGRLDDDPVELAHIVRRDKRQRRVDAHASSVRSLVTVKNPFVILTSGQRLERFPIAEGQDADFIALKKFFDDNRLPCRTEPVFDRDFPDGLLCLFLACGEHDTLASGETVSFDDHPCRVNRVEISLSHVVVVE